MPSLNRPKNPLGVTADTWKGHPLSVVHHCATQSQSLKKSSGEYVVAAEIKLGSLAKFEAAIGDGAT